MPKITKTIVDTAATPASGDAWIWDAELEGFGVRVQASGRKTYVVRYRTRDARRTQRKMTLCRCSDAPPDKARQLARDVFMAVAAGNDPAADRKPAKAAATLEDLFKARIVAMRGRDRANAAEVERVLLRSANNAADFLGRDKAPAEVTAADVVRYLSTYYKAGHRGAADKARGYLCAAFAWAIKSANDYTVAERQDWGMTHNPAADVARDAGAIKVRDRNLSGAELRVVWEACRDGAFSQDMGALLQVLMACGQRVHETLKVEGCEVDLEAGVWAIPAEKTKGRKRPHVIPLPAIVVPVFRRLKERHGDGPLFPARGAAGIISLLSVSQAVRRWLASEGVELEAFQPRDLRRTWKSRAHDAGVDRFTRDLIQQHAKNGDTGSKHYDRANYGPQMRDAMDKWSAWLEGEVFDKPALALVA